MVCVCFKFILYLVQIELCSIGEGRGDCGGWDVGGKEVGGIRAIPQVRIRMHYGQAPHASHAPPAPHASHASHALLIP